MSERSIRRSHDRAERAAERRRRRRAKLAAGVTVVGASAALAPAAQAANFTVDTLDDPGNGDTCAATDCSLREAIEDADANTEADTITFASGLTGTITLGSPLEVDSPDGIDIDGPGVSVVSISGDTDSSGDPSSGDTPILYVLPDAKLSISGLTLTQGYIDCSCFGKYAGGISMSAGSTVSIADAALTDNVGTTGGAVANFQGTLDVMRTELSGNYSDYLGGAIFASGPKYTPTPTPGEGEPMTTTITNSELVGNAAPIGGGAWLSGAKYTSEDPIPELGQATITGTTFSGNEASSGGGLASKYAETDVSGTTFSGTFTLTPTVATCGSSVGPDVITGDITSIFNATASGGLDAFTLGTTSCNIGTALVSWQGPNPLHPVIAETAYKYKVVDGAGRFEQIGIGWLKHGFAADTGSLCCTCQNPGNNQWLGIGCSDPYSASQAAAQSTLTPRWQVNAHTGVFPYPGSNPPFSGTTARRTEIALSDLEPSGGTTHYYAECTYVTQDDAQAGNGNNNASWKELAVTGGPTNYTFATSGSVHRMQPAITAWPALEPGVKLASVQVAGDGLVLVGSHATNLGGGQYH